MTIDLIPICCYISTNLHDSTFDTRLELLKTVVAMHDDWKCIDYIIDRDTRSGVNRPDLANLIKRMIDGEIRYLVVTHLSVIHPNINKLQELADMLKSHECGIISIYENLNTLDMDTPLK